MNIAIQIPDGKVDELVALYDQKYQIGVPKTQVEKKDFLSKVIQHEHITLLRQIVTKQKEEEAKQIILADSDIAESAIEAELNAKQAEKQAKAMADMERATTPMTPTVAEEVPETK